MPFADLAPGPSRAGPAEYRAGGRALRVSACFDTFWRFAAERQRIFHLRAGGAALPWAADPVLARDKVISVYPAADRGSQDLTLWPLFMAGSVCQPATARLPPLAPPGVRERR